MNISHLLFCRSDDYQQIVASYAPNFTVYPDTWKRSIVNPITHRLHRDGHYIRNLCRCESAFLWQNIRAFHPQHLHAKAH
jgi:hypothetical protein